MKAFVQFEKIRYTAETKKAILVQLLNDEDKLKDFWMPKSQVQYKLSSTQKGYLAYLRIPEWLCETKSILYTEICDEDGDEFIDDSDEDFFNE